MKTTNIFKCLLMVASLFLYSCSSDSDGDGETPPTGGGSGINAITVTASENSIELGNSITFTVTANDGSNVTSDATILINNSSLQGIMFTPTATGSYEVKARLNTLTSSAINIEVTPPVITALRVESAEPSIKVGDTAEFTVIGTDANGNDYVVTDDATISVDGNTIEGNRYMATTMTDFQATASLDGIMASAIDVSVTDDIPPATFARNAVIEDYTGTWCGWCPRVSYAIELVEAQSDRVFVVASHALNNDPMENSYSLSLANTYVTTGFPTAIINRDQEWTYPEPSNVAQATNLASGTTTSGISLNSMVVGNNLQVYVSTAFSQNTAGAKLVILVLEDGIVASQRNYTSYYGGEDPITQFEHNHVLRHAITNEFGDLIPTPNTMANTKYTQVTDGPIPSSVSDPSKMSIVAMIVDSNNKVINAAGAHVGVDKDYQAN